MAPEQKDDQTGAKENQWDLSAPEPKADVPPKTDEPAAALEQPTVDGTSVAAESADKEAPTTPVPLATMPFSNPNPLPIGGSGSAVSGRRSKKRLIIWGVIALVIVLLLAAAGTAYALYTKPENVLADALKKSFTANSVQTRGTLNVKDDEGSAAVKIDSDLPSQGFGQLVADASITANGQDIKLKGTVISDLKDSYVKVEGVDGVLDSIAQNGGAPRQEVDRVFGGVVDLIEGKWVSITRDEAYDLMQLSEEERQKQERDLTCVQDLARELRTNDELREPIEEAYKDNQFIVIKQDLGIETVNGRASHHYVIGIDVEKEKAFTKAVVETEAFKRYDDCSEDDLRANILEQDDAGDEAADTKVEVWIDRWNHEPTRLKVTNTDDGTDYAFDTTIALNKASTIQKPQADTTLKELTKELNDAVNGLIGGAVQSITDTRGSGPSRLN